jgi:hypothetical protein
MSRDIFQHAPCPVDGCETRNTGDDNMKTMIEAMKFLEAIEKKVTDRIVSTARLDDNAFKCHWTVSANPFICGKNVHCRFKLNGVTHAIVFDFEYDKDDNPNALILQAKAKILEKISGILAESLFTENIKEMME